MKQGSTRALGMTVLVAASALADAPIPGTGPQPASECRPKPTAWDREVRVHPTRTESINPQRFVGTIKGRLARSELAEFQGTLISLNPPDATDIGLALEPESYEFQFRHRRAWINDGRVYVYVENRKAPEVTRGVVIQRKVITWYGPEWSDLCYSTPSRYAIDVADGLTTEGVISDEVPWVSDGDHVFNVLTVIGTY
jgi:hypothetical protein